MTIKSRLAKAEKIKRAAEPMKFSISLLGYDPETGIYTECQNDGTEKNFTESEWKQHVKDQKIIEIDWPEDVNP